MFLRMIRQLTDVVFDGWRLRALYRINKLGIFKSNYQTECIVNLNMSKYSAYQTRTYFLLLF
jgi:hypothetical protein